MLECFERMLIPASTRSPTGPTQKQPALTAVLVQACVHASLHVPHLGPHLAHRSAMSPRPRQVGACRVFFCFFFSPQSGSVFTATRARLPGHVLTPPFPTVSPAAEGLKPGVVRKQQPPSRKQSASQPQLFLLIRRCETCCSALSVFAHSSQKTI